MSASTRSRSAAFSANALAGEVLARRNGPHGFHGRARRSCRSWRMRDTSHEAEGSAAVGSALTSANVRRTQVPWLVHRAGGREQHGKGEAQEDNRLRVEHERRNERGREERRPQRPAARLVSIAASVRTKLNASGMAAQY